MEARTSALLGLRLAAVTAAAVAALFLIPGASVADPTPEPSARPLAPMTVKAIEDRPNAADDANPVSMSPGELSRRPNTTTLTALEGDQTARPLTRAAAQLRVDSMSPTDWLARFGNVTVGQIETPRTE